MHDTFTAGTYAPYLFISVNDNNDLTSLETLDDYGRRIFIHEYTYFLQSISGSMGHSFIWNTFDRSRQLIAFLQKEAGNAIHIPINNDVNEEQRLFRRAMRTLRGDNYLEEPMEDATTRVQNVNFCKDKSFEELNPGHNNYFLNLQLVDEKGNECNYIFGDTAISETMAYLLERTFFETDVPANFPYLSCQQVGEYLETDILKNDEWLFALCDVALVSNFPGNAFYRILQNMHQHDFQPTNGESIIDYGLAFMNKLGWDVWTGFEQNLQGVQQVVQHLFSDPVFADTVTWFSHVMQTGFDTRRKYPYIFLEFFRSKPAFSGVWTTVYHLFGTPEVHNSLEQRFFQPPAALKHLKNTIEPLFFLSLREIHNTLVKGNRECGLLDCCARHGVAVDHRCKESPWERASDDKLCPYAFLWMYFDLAGKQVVIED